MGKIFKVIFFVIVLVIGAAYLELSGYVYHNDIIAKISGHNIEGLDVSHHQIKINWKKVDKKYKFVIMKATE